MHNISIERIKLNIRGERKEFELLKISHDNYKTSHGTEKKDFAFLNCDLKYQDMKLLLSVTPHYKLIRAYRELRAVAFIQPRSGPIIKYDEYRKAFGEKIKAFIKSRPLEE